MAILPPQNRKAKLTFDDKEYDISIKEMTISQEEGAFTGIDISGFITGQSTVTMTSDGYDYFQREYVGKWDEPVTKAYVDEGTSIGFRVSEPKLGNIKVMWGDKELKPCKEYTVHHKGNDMGYAEEKCADEAYYDGNALARKYNELSLDSDEKLLRKHGIIELDGTLTTKGKNFVTNILFDQYRDDVVEAIQAIEDAEREEKE